MFNLLGCVIFYRQSVSLKPFCEAGNVVFVVQFLFKQDIAKGIDQRHVTAVFQLKMKIGNACRFNMTRIADDDFCAIFTCFKHASGDDGVRVGAVIAEHQQAF
ncbi:Uncharacterised protein [Enterobacter cloacae]|nr:Uncharacterised protein [Enterobacter cloacae]